MRLTWSDISKHSAETGIDRGVLYPPQSDGIAWNGLVSAEVSTGSTEARSFYLEGQKVQEGQQSGDFEAAISAYTYPSYLDEQIAPFGLSYRTKIVDNTDRDHYKVHIMYDVYAIFEDITHQTVNNSIDAVIFGMDLISSPTQPSQYKSSTHIVLDSRYTYPWLMTEIEQILYGSQVTEPRLPDLQELLTIFEENSILQITNHGDGTWTASGTPVYIIGPTEFGIDWGSLQYIASDEYTVHSS